MPNMRRGVLFEPNPQLIIKGKGQKTHPPPTLCAPDVDPRETRITPAKINRKAARMRNLDPRRIPISWGLRASTFSLHFRQLVHS